jgi:SOS-response transcriptional repressor LexA
MVEEDKTPGERLREIRKTRYSTGEDAGLALGIPKGTYGGLENGSRTITPKRAKELADHFGVPAHWILYGGDWREMSQDVKKRGRTVSCFLATDILSFITLCDGVYPPSQKTIMIENVPDWLVSVEVPDRAMTREGGISFAAGTSVFVDPKARPTLADYQPEDVVQALIAGSPETVFREFTKRLMPDGTEQIILKPYNPKYPDIVFDAERGDKIIGRVVGMLFFGL